MADELQPLEDERAVTLSMRDAAVTILEAQLEADRKAVQATHRDDQLLILGLCALIIFGSDHV